jgi:hypothetical protein
MPLGGTGVQPARGRRVVGGEDRGAPELLAHSSARCPGCSALSPVRGTELHAVLATRSRHLGHPSRSGHGTIRERRGRVVGSRHHGRSLDAEPRAEPETPTLLRGPIRARRPFGHSGPRLRPLLPEVSPAPGGPGAAPPCRRGAPRRPPGRCRDPRRTPRASSTASSPSARSWRRPPPPTPRSRA